MARLMYRLKNLGSDWCISNHCNAIIAQGKLTYKFQLYKYFQCFSDNFEIERVYETTSADTYPGKDEAFKKSGQHTKRQAQESASHTRSRNLVSESKCLH